MKILRRVSNCPEACAERNETLSTDGRILSLTISRLEKVLSVNLICPRIMTRQWKLFFE